MSQQPPVMTPNGVPPQMRQPPQFNGVHSAHSSRDPSPSAARLGHPNIPQSQLPPSGRPPIPQSQLPPSRPPNHPQSVTQKMGQLNVNAFKTSTPNQSMNYNNRASMSPIAPTNGAPPPPNNQVPGGGRPLNQNHVIPPRHPEGGPLPPYSNRNVPPSQGAPSTPRLQTSASQPRLLQNPGQPPNQPQNFGSVPNLTGPPQPPAQPKANLHAKRYPQGPPVAPALNGQNYQQPQSGFSQQQPQSGFNQQQSNQFNQQNFGRGVVPQSPQQPYQQQQLYQQQQQSKQLHQQQQQQQFPGVVNSGFSRLWGQEHVDLLQNPNVLPEDKVEAPRVNLGQEVLDQANCSPEVFRCTMTKIPESNSLLQKSRLPLGVLIHPFKDLTHLPVIQCNVIVRCRACRTYINPFVFFVDSKRWKCNLCYRINELPEEFQFDPVSKTYGDPSRRPEIRASTIEYIAPAEYMLRPPQPAVYLLLFDVSRLAIESGYLQSVCQVLLEEVKNLPGDARTQLGVIAYDSALHFYSLGEGLSQPHEMTVLDIDDVFLPCPDNLLVNLKDRMDLIEDLLNQLPTRYNDTYDNNSALGAALQAAHKMMSATGGRVTVFQAALPNVGPGALVSREDPNQRAANEVPHLNPANDFYKRLALECSGQQIAVDLFAVNSQYVDIATISGISRFSGGCIHHFPLFKASRYAQNERFERSFRRYLTRKIGFEAVMRIRCTRGLSIHTFHGNFFVRSTDLLSLPNINPDAGFGMQVSIDENLSDVQSICFQAALLYTSSKGERRIRVHTLCLPTCATLNDVINSADQQCIVGLLAKMAVDRSMASSLADAREAFLNAAIDILSAYKLALNLGSGMSGLVAPQCLKLLPLYISALLKHLSFRTGSSIRLDDRVKAMLDMKTKPLGHLIQSVYPDLYPVHNLDEQKVVLNQEEEPVPQPPHLQLTARCLDASGAFLLDCGEHMTLLVCPGVSGAFLNDVLGVDGYASIGDDFYELPVLDNLHNQRLHRFVSFLNEDKPQPATLHVIRDNSPHRVEFFERLIEDRVENALSYHEFLQHLKAQIK